MSRTLTIPELSLVVLIGATGSGKSTFAREHFKPTQLVSSDACRGTVSDDENDQSATADAFALVHHIAGIRLRRGLLTVIDATSVQRGARESLVKVAREHDVLPVAIVLDLPESVCRERNAHRPELERHLAPRHPGLPAEPRQPCADDRDRARRGAHRAPPAVGRGEPRHRAGGDEADLRAGQLVEVDAVQDRLDLDALGQLHVPHGERDEPVRRGDVGR